MPRALWKGAISFGLINIPVELYAAEKHDDLDFTMLDKRDLAPVGYKRYNKKNGKEVAWDNIVKGYEYEDGQYVLLSDEDLRRANVEATQSIDIQAFVDADQVPITYYEQPYYLAPLKAGNKAYALLRETLRKSGKMAIAKIVIRTRQHIAAVMPFGNILNLITLRYPAELKAPDDLQIPGGARQSGVTAREVEMAQSLVDSMSTEWNPDDFHDTYRDDVLALVQKKIKSRQTHAVAEADSSHAEPSRGGAQVIDLMALLKKSIAGKQSGKGARDAQGADQDDEKSVKPASRAAPKRKTGKTAAGGKAKAAARAPAAKKTGRTATRPAARTLRSA
ncbi:Ku protein [Oxalobacteraceae bacterium CAVE-383]|nr:Ku protein [Oxalobacteraceae bacterium CAVE-383]